MAIGNKFYKEEYWQSYYYIRHNTWHWDSSTTEFIQFITVRLQGCIILSSFLILWINGVTFPRGPLCFRTFKAFSHGEISLVIRSHSYNI